MMQIKGDEVRGVGHWGGGEGHALHVKNLRTQKRIAVLNTKRLSRVHLLPQSSMERKGVGSLKLPAGKNMTLPGWELRVHIKNMIAFRYLSTEIRWSSYDLEWEKTLERFGHTERRNEAKYGYVKTRRMRAGGGWGWERRADREEIIVGEERCRGRVN